MSSSFAMTFAELANALADIHCIDDAKQPAFRSRLKNFHRLSFPIGLHMSKGKTATYGVGHMVEMALAVELTQLGLPPERVVRVLTLNWYPAAMAINMAARALQERPKGFDLHEVKGTDPLSMFLFFDPAALSPLMSELDTALTPDLDQASDTFFYGGEGVVIDNIVKWTSGYLSRISLINVTSLLDRLVGDPFPEEKEKSVALRHAFFSQIADWASDRSERGFGDGTDSVAEDFLCRFVSDNFAPPKDMDEFDHMIDVLEQYFGLKPELNRRVVRNYMAEMSVLNVDT